MGTKRSWLGLVLALLLLIPGVQAQSPRDLVPRMWLPMVVRGVSPTCYLYYWLKVDCNTYHEACLLRWMAYTWPEQCPEIDSFVTKALYSPPPWKTAYEWWLPDCCLDLDDPGCCITQCSVDHYGQCQGFLEAASYYSFKVWARVEGYENTPLGDWTEFGNPVQKPYLCYACYLPRTTAKGRWRGWQWGKNTLFHSPLP